MKYIGGFFELETPRGKGAWHTDVLELATGRACLKVIIDHVRAKTVLVPYYICDSVLATIRYSGAEPMFYALDERLRPKLRDVGDSLLLLVNYFGLQSGFSGDMARHLGRRCILDNTQAFYERDVSGHWALCSARKFFGVPDGAYLYAPEPVSARVAPRSRPNISHLVNRLAGRQQTAYAQCRKYEASITAEVRQMSAISSKLLAGIDYEFVRQARRANFLQLHEALREFNLHQPELEDGAAPYCYPLLLPFPVDRAEMAVHGLYVPTLWQDVIDRGPHGFDFEHDFAQRLLPLPIDQRYRPEDMSDLLKRLRRSVRLAALR